MLYGNFIVDFLWLIELPFGMVILSPIKLTCFHGNFVATQNFSKSKLMLCTFSFKTPLQNSLGLTFKFVYFKLSSVNSQSKFDYNRPFLLGNTRQRQQR